MLLRLTIVTFVVLTACADAPTCDDDLPDLTGDGAVDEADCAAQERGVTTHLFCDLAPLAWRDSDACASEIVERTSVELASPRLNAGMVAGVRDGRRDTVFAIVVGDDVELRSAHAVDNGWVASRASGGWSDGVRGWEQGLSRLVIWSAERAWLDVNDDRQVSADEIIDLSTTFVATQEVRASVASDGRLVVLGRLRQGGLAAWRDGDDDRRIDPDELTSLPDDTFVYGLRGGVLYYAGSGVRAWTIGATFGAGAGPALIDGDCGQVLRADACVSSTAPQSISWFTTRAGDAPLRRVLYLPPAAHEVRWDGGDLLSAQLYGTAADSLGEWTDTNGDLAVQSDQVVTAHVPRDGTHSTVAAALLSHPGANGDLASVVVEDSASVPGQGRITARLRRAADQFLGEPCTMTRPCAIGLTCRLASGSSVARCVPAGP